MLVVNNLYKGIITHDIPMIFLAGLFTLILLFIILGKSPEELEQSKEVVNQKKFTYSFDIKNITFISLKNEVKIFYEPLGFNSIVIDKEESWMLKNDKKAQSYISASLKNDSIKLEVYNAPEFIT